MSYTSFYQDDALDATFDSSGFTFPCSLVAWVKISATAWAHASNKLIMDVHDEVHDTGTYNNLVRLIKDNAADSVRAVQFGDTSNPGSVSALDKVSPYNPNWSDGDFDDIWIPVGAMFQSDQWRKVMIKNSTFSHLLINEQVKTIDPDPIFRYLRVGGNIISGWNTLDYGSKIAEVAVFDKVISNSEFDQLWISSETGKATNTIASSNCIGYWSLSSSQSTHSDESGNFGPDLVATGSVAFDSDHPTIIGGANLTNVKLVDLDTLNQSSLNNLQWDWFDQPDPKDFLAPVDQGNLETTDGTGFITISLPNSDLNSGQTGFLALRDSSNNFIGGYRLNVD